VSHSVTVSLGCLPGEPVVSVPVSDVCSDPLELFARVSDGRSDRERDHPVKAVLVLAAAAVVAWMGSFTAITGWILDVPAAMLAGLYQRASARRPHAVASSRSTRSGGYSPTPTRTRSTPRSGPGHEPRPTGHRCGTGRHSRRHRGHRGPVGRRRARPGKTVGGYAVWCC
jgi:hypothetical protein